MKLLNFASKYSDEASCRAKWKEYRDRHGVTCPACSRHKEHYWSRDKERCECKQCGNFKAYLKFNQSSV
jgi:Zn ribbon nucleic-acid-binding protein